MFKALLITKTDKAGCACALGELDATELPSQGVVTVRVDYSTNNYKDRLAITMGRRRWCAAFPW